MKVILVPIDGSQNSMRAVDYAIAQCKYGPTTVHILNVEPPLDNYGRVRNYMSSKQHNKAMRERAEEYCGEPSVALARQESAAKPK